jgi:hypothetical protein
MPQALVLTLMGEPTRKGRSVPFFQPERDWEHIQVKLLHWHPNFKLSCYHVWFDEQGDVAWLTTDA